jgi:ectoine hydrolase
MSETKEVNAFPKLRSYFSREEFLGRLKKVRVAMAARNIELLIISDPSNIMWISGYDGYSFYNHQCVVISLDREPVWFGRGIDVNGAKATVFMNESCLVGYPEEYVQRDLHPMEYFSHEVMKSQGWEGLSVGVEMDSFYFSAASFKTMEKFLPKNTWVDATGLVNWQRAVKSEVELDYMRIAGRILERIYARVFDVIRPGLKKNELVADIYSTAINGLDGFGGDYPSIVPLVSTGIEAATPHLTWNDATFEVGAGTFFEVAGVYRRYHCPVSRTVYIGRPPQKFLDAEKAVLEGIEAGLDMAKPGNTCEDIAKAFFSVMKRHGIQKGGRVGYPVGMSYPPDWGERTMSLRLGDRTILEAGMTFHFMPGLWFDDWGLEITETIVITPTGHACLSNVPRCLFIKD